MKSLLKEKFAARTISFMEICATAAEELGALELLPKEILNLIFTWLPVKELTKV